MSSEGPVVANFFSLGKKEAGADLERRNERERERETAEGLKEKTSNRQESSKEREILIRRYIHGVCHAREKR